MHYVTNMGQLYSLSTRRYREFLRMVSMGISIHEALDGANARFIGININVTGWGTAEARIAHSTLSPRS
jgi:hypothetical protein